MSLGLSVGTCLPAYCTSMGRILLAAEPHSLMRERLQKTKLALMTHWTVTDPDALAEIIAKARNDGYCLVEEELELGLCSLAVPVRNAQGTVVAAMNVSAQAGRISSATMLEHMLPVLHAAAESLAPVLVS